MEIGLKIEYKFEVTELTYKGFQSIFLDQNILHTNSEYAKSKGFENKVMYGNILNGFVSYFVGELLPDKNVIIQKQETSFHKPVYMEDSLDFEASLVEYFESVNSYIFKYKFKHERGIVAKGKVQIGLI
jgi:acyl dehydratase